MATLSKNEEDYLKGLYYLLSIDSLEKVGTNQLATKLDVTPASANNMLKKLKAKKLVAFEPYGKIELTEAGNKIAVYLIRKHRLWETFLYKKLDFTWDEVHEVAEQLEHIQSTKLIDKLEEFLEFPKHDPHGDPIPDAAGHIDKSAKLKLGELNPGERCHLVGVKDNSAAFLQYVSQLGLELKSSIVIVRKEAFDNSLIIRVDQKEIAVSEKFGTNVYVVKESQD